MHTSHTQCLALALFILESLALSGDTLTVTESVALTGGLERDLKVHLILYNYN